MLKQSRWTAVAVLMAAALALAACTAESSAPEPPEGLSFGTVASSTTGDTCTDPAGDLLDDADQPVAEPPGIDLLFASAELVEDHFEVRLETAAAIESAPNPLFLIQHGDLGQAPEASWELRLERQGPAWSASIVTFPSFGLEEKDPLDVAPIVDGASLSVDIPTDDLPPFKSVLWAFGSSAGVSSEVRVYDDCVAWLQSSTEGTTPAGTAPDTSLATPTTSAPVRGAVGEALAAEDGTTVTVHEVIANVDVPETAQYPPIPGTRFVLVDAEVCAGASGGQVGDERFILTTDAGRTFEPWGGPEIQRTDRFPVEVTLRPSDCQRGWIQFEVPVEQAVTDISYDLSGSGVGPLLIVTV